MSFSPRNRSLAVALVLALFLLLLMPLQTQALTGGLDVSLDGNSSIDASAGESSYYNWTVTNSDPTATYHGVISMNEPPEGWVVLLSPRNFTLGSGQQTTVSLLVRPSEGVVGTNYQAFVTFTFQNNSTGLIVDSEVNTVTTHAYKAGLFLGFFENPLPPPLDNDMGLFVLSILFWMFIAMLLVAFVDPLVNRVMKKQTKNATKKLHRLLRGPIFMLVMIYGLFSSLELLDLPKWLLDIVQQMGFIAMFLLAVYIVYKIFIDVLIVLMKVKAEKTETEVDDILVPFIEKIGKVIIVLAVIFYLLGAVNIDLGLFMAGGVVVSMVIAFAAQDTLSNFFSGMFIMMDQPFKVGDYLLMENGDYCEVKDIGLRTTNLYNLFDHEMVFIPNNKLANQAVINLTLPDTRFKVKIRIGVAYDSDTELVKKLMLDTALEHTNVLKEDGVYPFARLINFGDSSLDFKLYTWVDDINNQWRVGAELREAILMKFRANNIEIPFPQRVVWMPDQNKAEVP